MEEKGHFYVCGDCTMAEHVYQTLKIILQELGQKSEQDVEKYMLSMRVREMKGLLVTSDHARISLCYNCIPTYLGR